MKKLIPTFVLAFILHFSLYAQQLDFAVGIGGSDLDLPNDITCDANNNSYITGSFEGTVDFDPGTGVHSLTSIGNFDIFLLKLDANGNFVWVKQFGGSSAEIGYSVALDSENNIYLAGYCTPNTDFDPGTNTKFLPGHGSLDAFVVKLNAEGNFVWAINYGGPEGDYASDILIDSDNNLIISGDFSATADFNPETDEFKMTSAGWSDAYVLKLDKDGKFIWAVKYGGADSDNPLDIALDSDDNIYTCGYFSQTATFGTGNNKQVLTSGGDTDGFLAKYDKDGNLVDLFQKGGSYTDSGQSVTIDKHGNIIWSGKCYDISTYSHEMFVEKMAPSGTILWSNVYNNKDYIGCLSCDIDVLGNIYCTGSFRSDVNFGTSESPFNLSSAGSDDVFVLKLDPNGNTLNTVRWGGNTEDIGTSIFIGTDNKVFTTGECEETLDLNPFEGKLNYTFNGIVDIFVSEIDLSVATNNDSVKQTLPDINPFISNGVIYFNYNGISPNKLIVIDINGVELIKVNSPEISVNISWLPNGIYLLKFEYANQTIVKKIIKK